MHGTVEWLPGQPLGNDRQSWSDEMLGKLPNLYIYAANNPSGKFLCVLTRFPQRFADFSLAPFLLTAFLFDREHPCETPRVRYTC
jgi:hypothetical protein